jgi:membrane-bound serine protease (ClpP class)
MLYDSPLPELRLTLSFIAPIVLGLSGIILFLVQLGVKAQRTKSITGESGMIGEVGEALTAIPPNGAGRVRAHGEIWSATSAEAIAVGDAVRITAVRGLVLTVRPEAGAAGMGRVMRPEEAS